MRARVLIPALLLLAMLAAGVWWLRPGPPPRRAPTPSAAEPAAPLAAPPASPGRPAPPAAVPRQAARSPGRSAAPAGAPESVEEPSGHAAHGDEEPEDPSGDLALYDRRPMSAVPHVVVRGWGAGGSSRHPGYVGAHVVVDPEIGDEELEQLARNICEYHRSAYSISAHIYDSEEAATYDRHRDGGALAQQHEVARVSRNDRLETDVIEVRGRQLQCGASGPAPP